VLSRARIAVFVDGCFWHACQQHGGLPKNNRDWWAAKQARNVAQDREKDEALRSLGWLPLHLWEHTPVEDMAERVVTEWRTRTGRD
jgi:DNA mismatch endonuclease (patch repair protein)